LAGEVERRYPEKRLLIETIEFPINNQHNLT